MSDADGRSIDHVVLPRRRIGLALLVPVDFRAADNPVRHAAQRAGLAAEEIANVVAKTPVPFFPGVADEAADLVESGGIPGFRIQLRSGEHRIGLDVPQHGRVRKRRAGRVAGKNRRQVEAEPVDVHFLHPVAQAVDD